MVSLEMLNRWFRFVGVVRSKQEVAYMVANARPSVAAPTLLVDQRSLRVLCAGFKSFCQTHVSTFFKRHCLRMGYGSFRVDAALDKLKNHACAGGCPPELFVFAEMKRERRPKKVVVHEVRRRREQASRRRAVPVEPHLPDPIHPVVQEDDTPVLPVDDSPLDVFPEQYSTELRDRIILEWQAMLSPAAWMRETCAVCGRMDFRDNIVIHDATDEQLDLLRDESVPDELLPDTYALDSYRYALLHPAGLIVPLARGLMRICKPCMSSLKRRRMPRDALANKLYYAHDRLPPAVKRAFDESSMADRMYVAGCRTTRITYIINNPTGKDGMPRQRMNRGHCSVIPQDFGTMSSLIPASPNDMSLGLCVLFVGRGMKPTKENIAKFLHPVVTSIPRISIMSSFLAASNPTYRERGIVYSEENLRAIASSLPVGENRGLSSGVHVAVLDSGSAAVVQDALRSSYVGHSDRSNLIVPAGELLIENVGYANDSQSSMASTSAKTLALEMVLERQAIRSGRRWRSSFS